MAHETVGITGAAGQIGSRLRPRLARLPMQFRLFDLRPAAGPETADGLSIHAVDIARWEELRDVFSGLTQLVHLAAVSDEADWERIRGSNMDGTYHVFEAARQAGVRR